MSTDTAEEVIPEESLLVTVKRWMTAAKMAGEAIVVVSKRSLFIVGKDADPYKWVLFWDPTTKSVKGGTGVVRFYDWESIPTKLKISVNEAFAKWKAKK